MAKLNPIITLINYKIMRMNFTSIFKTNKIVNTFFLLYLLFSAFTTSYAQCGFLDTCPDTDYLNFGMGSTTNAATLEYDNFTSSFHATAVRTSTGVYKLWGQAMANNGTSDLLSPTIIDNTNFPALTGAVLKVGLGSKTLSAQGILLSTTGLFAWGKEGTVLHADATSSSTFQKLIINGQANGLPSGVIPTDVKMMFVTSKTVAIVTCGGDVWVITSLQGENTGTGLTGTLSAGDAVKWHRVTDTSTNPLTNIIAVRGAPNSLFALKSDGTLWTWGTQTYLADNLAQGSRDRATSVTLPSLDPIKMIGATSDGGLTSYYVLNANGNLYSLGDNSSSQLGDWTTTTERPSWVQPRYTSKTGPIMNNIHWISPEEHDGNYGNINVLNSDSMLYNWGSAQGEMLGRGGTGTFDPGIPLGIEVGSPTILADKILAVETGGHTTMISKKCTDFFGYVGHRIGGSMADGTPDTTTESIFTYKTAVVYICGASSIDLQITGTPTLSTNGKYCNGTSTTIMGTPSGGTYSKVSGPATLVGNVLTFTGIGTTIVGYTVTDPDCGVQKTTQATLISEDCNANVGIVKTVDNATPNVGDNVTFTLTASNAGPYGATGVVVNDILSAGYTFVSATVPTIGTWTAPNWTIGSLSNAASASMTITATVNASGSFANTATISANETDPVASNDSSTVTPAVPVACPDTPTLSATAASCSASGTSTISNYNVANTYTFSPATAGITINGAGLISGLTAGTSYKVKSGNGSCTSVDSASFSNAAQLATPTTPTLSGTAASCSASGISTISNYNVANTYTFSPATAGITISGAGLISGLTAGTSYTVTSGNGSCTSVNSASFSNAAQLATPTTPTLSATAASCSASGISTISNYNAANTYTFTPATAGITINGAGLISGLTAGTSYKVKSGNGSCTSVDSASFSNSAQLATPATPLTTVTQPTCATATGTITVTVQNASDWYSFDNGANFQASNIKSLLTAGTSYNVIIKSVGGCSSTATATALNVKPNCTPIAVDDTYTVAEDSSVTLTPLTGDSDADIDTLIIISINGTLLTPGIAQVITVPNGTVNITSGGTITFTPALNFNSSTPINISYVISDGNGGTATASEIITVTPVNDAPIVDNDVNTTTEDNPTVGGDLTDAGDSDPDGTPLIVTTTPVSGPTNGTIVINTDGTYVYTPNPNFNGTDVITIEVCDQGLPLPKICVNQTLTITVTPVNDSPIVDNDVNTTNEDNPTVGGDLTDAGDSDPDGTPLIVTTTPVSGPTNGTIVINTDGTYVYTPNPNFNGTDVITIEVCDSGTPLPKMCVNQTLTITVTPVNDTPIVDNDVNTTNEDTPTVGGDLTDAGDSDPDGTPLVVTTTPVSGPSNGTIVINTDGTYVYTPNPNFNGTDIITIEVCDSGTPLPKICVNQTLTITVTPVNDLPVAANDSATTLSDVNVIISVSSNDYDIDGTINSATIDLDSATPGIQTIFVVAGEGTYTANANGTVTFDPLPSFSGNTTPVNYIIQDNLGGFSNIAKITVNVGACVDNPVLDCDGDGVKNGQEVIDGTNPLDPCDSIEEHVTVQQSAIFLNGDCDGDGLLNGEEIGTDPTHPFDSNGNGIPDYLEINNHNSSNSEDDLEIFNGVSPTSDDVKNSVFTIRNIEKYPNNTLEIYNRWGVLVYEVSGYGQGDNFFKGESAGRVTISASDQLPEDTYYYMLKYVKSDGTVKERTGYLYINR